METIYQTIVKDCGCDVGAFDKKNFDEINKLVNAAAFKPGVTS